ncbi:MAG: transposase [Clostridia bacterium]|nr:transposase [Clostridia bacterium]
MPRKARQKNPQAIFHIMCRSISEFFLFRDDDDKNKYLELLKRYTEKYKCSIYAYCLMNNHLHIQLDPKGFDVSKFMHCTNTAYVRYYNIKYKRHGHVFQDRFESRVLDTDEYNLAVSAYIHNNPQDLDGFSGKEQDYKYSSYGIYLGKRKDIYGLVDKSFIKGLFNVEDENRFVDRYFAFVSHQRDVGSFKEINKKLLITTEYQYVSGRRIILRDLLPVKVMSYISDKLMLEDSKLKESRCRGKVLEFRAFTVYALRVLCGLSYKEICNCLYNLTISGCSSLCSRGFGILKHGDSVYKDLLNELICIGNS